jgi:eukaryotic-like serine/threonine-protein kinase
MTMGESALPRPGSLSLANQIDHLCDCFEAAWREGPQPSIERFLALVDDPLRSMLLTELLKLELALRMENRQSPMPGEYLARFPDHRGEIDAAFAQRNRSQPLVTPRSLGPQSNTIRPHAQEELDEVSLAARKASGPNLPIVPGYDILEELGQGAMGVVYKARPQRLKRLCALKMILAGALAPDDFLLPRFLSEAEAVARLQHPNIVQVYNLGDHDGRPFLELEYVDGGSLAHRLDGTPWPPLDAAALVETLARAMAEAHRQGIVHRDLKPSNVLLTADGTPKITDFGLAKTLGADSSLTKSGAIVGTPSYMAPEQAEGKSKEVGPAADIYALGAILYELVTGRPPFRAAQVLTTLEQVKNAEPVSPSRLQPGLPRDVETIALKCLSKEPEKRYGSAAALAEDLRRFRSGESILAQPVGRLERLWRWCRRNPVVALLLTAVTASLVIGTLVSWRFATRALAGERDARANAWRADQNARLALEREQSANQSSYVIGIGAAKQLLDRAAVDNARELLNNLRPKPGQNDLRGFEWYHLWRLAHAEKASIDLLTLFGGNLEPYSLRFTPDGKTLTIAASDGQLSETGDSSKPKSGLTRRELPAGQPRVVIVRTKPAFDTCLGAMSPDGQRAASLAEDGTVTLWDATTGNGQATFEGRDEALRNASPGSLAFSPDGQALAAGFQQWAGGVNHETTIFRLIDLATHKERIRFEGGSRAVFSSDGKTLVTGDYRDGLKIWDVASGQLRFSDQTAWSNALAISPDGQTVACVSGTVELPGEISLWQVATGKKLATPANSHRTGMSAVAYSPDGRILATGSFDSTVKLWDAATFHELETFKGHTGQIRALVFSPDGNTLASGGSDSRIELWDTANIGTSNPLSGNDHAPIALAFSPDDKILATAGWDLTKPGGPGLVKLWDLTTGKVLHVLTGFKNAVHAVTFSPDGKTVVTGGGNWHQYTNPGEVKLWDTATGRERMALEGVPGNVTSLAISPDGKTLATAGVQAVLWDFSNGKQRLVLQGARLRVFCVAYSPSGTMLATGGGGLNGQDLDGEVVLWDAATNKPLGNFEGHRHVIYSLAFSPDEKTLATACWDKTASLWDVATREEKVMLDGHSATVYSVSFSRDGQTLATSSADQTVKLWNAATGKEQATLKMAYNPTWEQIHAVSFSHDGRVLASACYASIVQLWDPATRHKLAVLSRGHSYGIGAIAFAPDGRRFATAGLDATVKVWGTATGNELATLAGHEGEVETVAFAAGGRLLASGGADKSVIVWDLATGAVKATLKGHTNPVRWLTFSPDCRTLATASTGGYRQPGEVILWDIDSNRQRATFLGYDSVAFSPDGKTLASQAYRSPVPSGGQWKPADTVLWDPSTGNELLRLHSSRQRFFSLQGPPRFSSDGQLLAVDGPPTLWDLATRRSRGSISDTSVLPKSFTGRGGTAFSQDCRTAAVSNGETAITLWDFGWGQQRFTLEGHHDRVSCVAISADGRTIVSGTSQGVVTGNRCHPCEIRIWRASSDAEVAADTAQETARAEAVSRLEALRNAKQPRPPSEPPPEAISPERTTNGNALIRRFRNELTFSASSTSFGSVEQVVDGDPETSWRSAWHDSAAKGSRPWMQVNFPSDVTVSRVTILSPLKQGSAILAGTLELLDRRGKALASKKGDAKREPCDYEFLFTPPIQGVQRVRWTSERDQGADNPLGGVTVSEVLVE